MKKKTIAVMAPLGISLMLFMVLESPSADSQYDLNWGTIDDGGGGTNN